MNEQDKIELKQLWSEYEKYIKELQLALQQGNSKVSQLKSDDAYNWSKKFTESKVEILNNAINEKVSESVYNENNDLISEKFIEVQKTTEGLASTVSKKVGDDEVISKINQSAEGVQIDARQIDLNGNLDLNGTFKCYKNGADKTGHFLYQSGAIHRGYLEGWSKPVFSSGIWKPDGINDTGYVAVGWSNSDAVDANGCLWMSPKVRGGAVLNYGQLDPNTQQVLFSGIEFTLGGFVKYYSFVKNKQEFGIIGHHFDGGVGCYTLSAHDIICRGNIKLNNSIYTDSDVLYFVAGGYNNPFNLLLNKTGYLLPTGAVQLGINSNPFYQLVCTHAPAIISDARKKKDIEYIDNNNNKTSDTITKDDMYSFIRDKLKLATYKLIDNREEDKNKVEIGFIAQDIKDTKVGRYIVDSKDDNNLVYDIANRMSVIEGALQKAIEKIEILEEEIEFLKTKQNV